jgi:hypothetical protein
VKILVGGHSDVAMARAARHDGWISANCTEAELGELVPKVIEAAAGKPDFEINALAVDILDPDGFHRLEALGVTDAQVVPWFFYGGDPTDLAVQVDSLARFADTVIAKMEA